MPNATTTRTNTFVRTLAGAWEFVSIFGRTEVYREYGDGSGIRAFLGYVEDHVLHFLPPADAREALAVLAAHEAAA